MVLYTVTLFYSREIYFRDIREYKISRKINRREKCRLEKLSEKHMIQKKIFYCSTQNIYTQSLPVTRVQSQSESIIQMNTQLSV